MNYFKLYTIICLTVISCAISFVAVPTNSIFMNALCAYMMTFIMYKGIFGFVKD